MVIRTCGEQDTQLLHVHRNGCGLFSIFFTKMYRVIVLGENILHNTRFFAPLETIELRATCLIAITVLFFFFYQKPPTVSRVTNSHSLMRLGQYRSEILSKRRICYIQKAVVKSSRIKRHEEVTR